MYSWLLLVTSSVLCIYMDGFLLRVSHIESCFIDTAIMSPPPPLQSEHVHDDIRGDFPFFPSLSFVGN